MSDTPITDAVTGSSPLDKAENLQRVARRLERDRAALMEAVANLDPYPEEAIGEKVHNGAVYCEISVGDMRAIRAALAAARANFPTV